MLTEEDPAEAWKARAACSSPDVDPELFFPPRDKVLYNRVANQAREHCFGTASRPPCPVRLECLKAAIDNDEEHGIWGGLSHRERNALVRKWHRTARHMGLAEFIEQHGK